MSQLLVESGLLPIIVRLAFTAFGLLLLRRGLLNIYAGRKFRTYGRRIAGAEPRAVGDLQPGRARVEGTARPTDTGDSVEAPVSESDALAMVFGVEKYEASLFSLSSTEEVFSLFSISGYEEVFEHCEAAPFVVEDDTGAVVIDAPPEGEFDIDTDATDIGIGERPPDRIRRFVERVAGEYADDLLSESERRRYQEGLVEPSDEVTVVGEVREGGTGWSDAEYAITGGSEPESFVLADTPADDLIKNMNQAGVFLYVFGGVSSVIGAPLVVGPWVL